MIYTVCHHNLGQAFGAVLAKRGCSLYIVFKLMEHSSFLKKGVLAIEAQITSLAKEE